ncbi:DUF6236 family protein [Nocardia abscessus]|uniref:DUF6236 family protein n=1 Tax=Nocardia abscessus TaxID=120957 RepID=UPI00245797F6|nr:DUF6236 family protein [Nocardia abscessus]
MPDLLYYPRINAPRSVIYEAMLYWDRLVTVVPPGSPEEYLDPAMRQVHAAGFYMPLVADDWPMMPGRDLERVLWQLTHMLDQIPADDLIPNGGPDNYVYAAKLSSEIRDELERRGLSLRLDRSRLRIHVSAATQLCLISTAARDIARRFRERDGRDGRNVLYPYTDSPAAHLFAHMPFAPDYRPPFSNDLTPGRSPRWAAELSFPERRTALCWEVQVGGLLPVPNDEVLLDDLITFRERYDGERQRLMEAIDRLVRGLQRNYDHPQDVLHEVRRDLESALADLTAAGRSTRIKWVRRSVTVSIALAAGYAGQKLFPEATWVLGVIGGAAINIATNQTRPTGHGVAGDFSYLHRVRSALG